MKTNLFYTFLIIPLFLSGCSDKDDSPLEGVWEMTYKESIQDGNTITFTPTDDNRQVKIFTDKYVTWLRYKPNTDWSNTSGGYGKYTFNDKTFTETYSMFSTDTPIGLAFTFNYEIRGDTLIQSGPISIDPPTESIKWDIKEVYIRLE